MKKLRLILGDQLNASHPWFDRVDEDTLYCMFEMRQETDYVVHHIQKVAAFFTAMRLFKEKMTGKGHRFIYFELNHDDNRQNLKENLQLLIQKNGIEQFEYQLPDEYRLDVELKEIGEDLSIPVVVVDTEHFYTKRDELRDFFGKKEYLMERFYRHMRKKHKVLMQADWEPLGGKWNYDKENRNKIPAKLPIPDPVLFSRDVSELVTMIYDQGVETMGSMEDGKLHWPLTAEEAVACLDYFVEELLPDFGKYQDAMTSRSAFLFHSRLSFAMNVKLIDPGKVVDRVEAALHRTENPPGIAQVEGFIRQVLGWREYMRGIYWAQVPDYYSKNFFDHQRPLPAWYWTGKTKMNCLRNSIGQSLDKAYAHHIQRLMVTGNFALLAGCSPDDVDRWYLGVYIDAIEWVEITNTRGMSQYADGGLLATKPFISSSNYLHKMSDNCGDCPYDRKKKTGENACPFNSLYWNFLMRHRSKLESNPRMGMMYRLLDKMPEEEKEGINNQANHYLEEIEKL